MWKQPNLSKFMLKILGGLAAMVLWVGLSGASTTTDIANGTLETAKGDVAVNIATIVFTPDEPIACHKHIDVGLKLAGSGGVDGFVTITAGSLDVTQNGITITYGVGGVIPEPTMYGLAHKAVAGPNGATVVVWRARPVDEPFRVLVDDSVCERGAE